MAQRRKEGRNPFGQGLGRAIQTAMLKPTPPTEATPQTAVPGRTPASRAWALGLAGVTVVLVLMVILAS